MGQSSSSHSPSPPRSGSVTLTSSSSSAQSETRLTEEDATASYIDYTSYIPDDCLALIFQYLTSGDRNRCSLVSKRWLLVDGQSRHRLTLNAQSEISPFLSPLFSRLDSVTKLSLRCDRRSVSIDDTGFISISFSCRRLTRLKLRSCREITDAGMASFATNCKQLTKFSCGSCTFGAKGINALLNNCSSLEQLSVRRLRVTNDDVAEPIGPGAAASSIRSIHLKELYNGQAFGPLISGAKKLTSFKLLCCFGDWDNILETIAAVPDNNLTQVHLERVQVSDIGLSALSNCPNLQTLHIIKTPDCSNAGLITVVGSCKYLRKLHIDGLKTNRIGHDALIAIAKHLVHLKELVLIGINPSSVSLEAIAMNCQKLERLALCGSDTVYDSEVLCIASKCVALKKLCIKGCPVSDEGIGAFAWGCPNLVKIKVKKCRNVTGEIGDWLRARRGSLVVALDDGPDATTSESGVQEHPVEVEVEVPDGVGEQPEPVAPRSSGRGSGFKNLFRGRGLSACTYGRRSVGSSSSSSNGG